MATVLNPPDQRIILCNVSWDTYERLLDERGDKSVPRFSYDQGVLEIMSPSNEHEEYKCALDYVVSFVASELRIRLRRLGSTTFRRRDVDRGFEPDACYYIQSLLLVQGRRHIDLLVDPPPDLIIEVDISSDSLKKLGIYAALGIPEVWRYDGTQVTILQLEDGGYKACEISVALPLLSVTSLTEFIDRSTSADSLTWEDEIREWARKRARV